MTETANLSLPCIEAGQAQKHVTHNEALRLLDTLVQLAVLDRDLNAPPASPGEGQRWLVKASPSPTGAWAGHGNQIAAWQGGAWQFSAPKSGWVAYVVDEGTLLFWDGDSWEPLQLATALQNLTLLGVGTTADATNPFAAKLNNALFTARYAAEGGDGDLRCKLNKEGTGDTVSQLYQKGFSGRAETGLVGNDDFTFKVSPDGSTWYDGIVIRKDDGKVAFPSGIQTAYARERLAANRTYYVRTDGSDSNNGLADSTGGAFLTVQKAIDACAAIDLGIYNVTIQVKDGTYSGAVAVKGPWLGSGTVTIQGNAGTPANVLLSTGSADAITCQNGGAIYVKDLKLTNSGSYLLRAKGNGFIDFQNLDFGACGSVQVRAEDGGAITASGNYTISAGAGIHWQAAYGSVIRAQGRTVTLTGTPAFSAEFALVRAAALVVDGNTFSGSATGPRYLAEENGVIRTLGSGTYLPGNSAGSTATGGQYV